MARQLGLSGSSWKTHGILGETSWPVTTEVGGDQLGADAHWVYAGQEPLIGDFTYNDGGGNNLDNREGYVGLKWNAYANTNQGGGYTVSMQTTFRYEDNAHIRAGLPVSCTQIGFMGGPRVGQARPSV